MLSEFNLSENQRKIIYEDLTYLFDRGYDNSVELVDLSLGELNSLIHNYPHYGIDINIFDNKFVIKPGKFYIKHIYPDIEFQATIIF